MLDKMDDTTREQIITPIERLNGSGIFIGRLGDAHPNDTVEVRAFEYREGQKAQPYVQAFQQLLRWTQEFGVETKDLVGQVPELRQLIEQAGGSVSRVSSR